MKIYTRGGDAGETGLFGGERVAKDDPRVDAIGAIDEVNAALGMAASLAKDSQIRESIVALQQELFAAGWDLSTPLTSDIPRINGNLVLRIENEIDMYEVELPALKNFILPGGSELSAALHLARCSCRRAERRVVALMRQEHINLEIERFLNRVSDHLFVLARVAAHRASAEETIWKRP
jgi:cob(I)alamin adenosyltransferase